MTTVPSETAPLVAVIQVAYGGRDYTLACLKSLGKSNYKNLKIILVDNDSPDDTSELVSKSFPEVEIIKIGKNLGFAGGNNVGIDRALQSGVQFILLLNNDTEVDPDAIDKLVERAQKTDKLGAIGPTIYYHSAPDLIWSAGGIINFKWSFLKHRGIREKDRGQYSESVEVDYLTGCAIMFPAKIISEVGKLDESYWMYYEDADLCARLKRAGYKIVFEPDSKVWHKISSSTGGNISSRKMWFKFRSGWRFFKTYSPSGSWIITYPISQFVIYIKVLVGKSSNLA